MQDPRVQKRPLRIRLWLEKLFTTEQFTFSHLLSMFVPLVLDQLFIFGIGILSTAMVSSSGEAAISAVSMVNSMGFIVSALFGALSTGGTILVARAHGSGDTEHVRLAIGQAMMVTTLVAVMTSMVLILFPEPLVRLFYPKAEPLIQEYAVTYMRLMGWSNIPFALFNVIFGAFRGLGDAKSSLALTLVINTVHLIASFVFINGLGLGVTGSGLSYILARVIGAVVALFWMFRIKRPAGMRLCDLLRFVPRVQREIVSLGIPLAMEQVLFQAGLLLSQMYIATLATSTIAANGIAGSAFGLFNAVAFSLTTMVTTVCGQCIGAKRLDLARHYVDAFTRAGRLVLLATALILGPLMPLVLKLYSPTAEALPQIYLALAIVIVPLPLLWCGANIPGAAFRAAGDALYVTAVSMVAMWAARVGLGYLLTIPLGFGIAGVWLAVNVEWAIRLVLFRPRLRSGKWLNKAKLS